MSTRFSSLPSIESNFFNRSAAKLQSFDYSKDKERVQGYFYTPSTNQFYYTEAQTKKRIVFHFTAGNLNSDMNQLTKQDYHVSVPFVIARDGKIFQLFYSKYWSHHLGMTTGNPGKIYDKQSIGIELCNYGWLTPVGLDLETIYSRQINQITRKPNPVDTYCTLLESKAYRKSNEAYREQSYYATYTEAQIESLVLLVRYLTELYQIPRVFLPVDQRFITSKHNMDFAGIVSHINYRASGKWDIGPAFDWDTLITGVQTPHFVPTINPIQTTRGRVTTKQEKEFTAGKTKGSKYNSHKKTVIRAYDPYDWE